MLRLLDSGTDASWSYWRWRTGRNTVLKSAGSYRIHSNEDNSRYWINVTRFILALRNDVEKSVAIKRNEKKVKKKVLLAIRNSSPEIYTIFLRSIPALLFLPFEKYPLFFSSRKNPQSWNWFRLFCYFQ